MCVTELERFRELIGGGNLMGCLIIPKTSLTFKLHKRCDNRFEYRLQYV